MVELERGPVRPDDVPAPAGSTSAGWWHALATFALPLLAGLWAAATTFGGTVVPWRSVMVDLGVYLRAGGQVLQQLPVYDEGSELPFLYPPLAALLAVPLTALPVAVVEIGWVVLNVALLLAVMYRFNVRGWALGPATAGVVLLVEPVKQTLAFGQLGIILVALVVLDLVPGARFLDRWTGGRRLLPEGWASGLGAALKLTPGITVPYLFLAGRRRSAAVALGTFLGLGLLAALVMPRSSWAFWTRLASGESGLGGSVIYYANQSISGAWLRIFRLAPGSELTGLAVSAVAAALGIAVAVLWHRRGETGLAVALLGVASLLASPVSWGHHFVWVVPLALVMARPQVPMAVRATGLVFAVYVAAAPWETLPGGADVELTYDTGQLVLASLTPVLGLVLMTVALLDAVRRTQTGTLQQLPGSAPTT
ncbi:glycosyltransferase 87 family protein [Desertihabitans aurantiacus]|uniref:glycosyltransferase 87 family protein n=1 Tax=Desertihabitans aurantiacus TaxID=2282477 RepID=UPI000DF741C8|nr:glycosyltransferase 87 family protein [Desertihabitans aurantiacus]